MRDEHFYGKLQLYTGTARPGSDIDIVINTGTKRQGANLALLRLELDSELNVPFKIDLTDFSDLPDAFQEAVKREGIVWRK